MFIIDTRVVPRVSRARSLCETSESRSKAPETAWPQRLEENESPKGTQAEGVEATIANRGRQPVLPYPSQFDVPHTALLELSRPKSCIRFIGASLVPSASVSRTIDGGFVAKNTSRYRREIKEAGTGDAH